MNNPGFLRVFRLWPVLLFFSFSALADVTAQQADQTSAPDMPAGSASAQRVLQTLGRDVQTLQADFYQYQPLDDGSRRDESRGIVSLMAPDRFRWHYQKPEEQLIIATGDEILIYDPDLEQVTIKPQRSDHSPLYVLFNPDVIEQHYHLLESRRDNGLLWITLAPKQADDAIRKAMLGIDAKNNRLATIHLLDNLNQTVVFEFTNIRRNPELDAALFQFTPPEGVDIVYDQPSSAEF